MKISELIKDLEQVQTEYGDKDIVFVQYGAEVGGDYEYGHLLTEVQSNKKQLVASLTDLTKEIELYTTTE